MKIINNADIKKAVKTIKEKIECLSNLIVAVKDLASVLDNESSEFSNAITLIKQYSLEKERLKGILNKFQQTV